MKKTFLGIALFAITFVLISGEVSAMTVEERREAMEQKRAEMKERMEERKAEAQQRKEEIQQKMEQKKEERQGMIEQMKEKVKSFGAKHTNGEITAINGTALTVKTKEGTSYTVDATKAQLLRRYGGKATISEFVVGNSVNVVGKPVEGSENTIEAKVVRNLSVQKRFGAFFGKVTAKGTTSFTIEAEKRGKQTVNYSSVTKFTNREGKAITVNDIQIGDRVRVKGIWDNSTNIIIVSDTEREGVKDFDLPKRDVTPSGSPVISQ